MWNSPKPRKVKLQANAFKNMRNLKFLLVKNVQISEGLKYLPNELRLLQWPRYDFPLPSKFYPHNLVVLNMPNSQIRLEKLFKQVWVLVYMNFEFFFFFLKWRILISLNVIFKICRNLFYFYFSCRTARLKNWKISISRGVKSLQNYLPYYAPQT